MELERVDSALDFHDFTHDRDLQSNRRFEKFAFLYFDRFEHESGNWEVEP